MAVEAIPTPSDLFAEQRRQRAEAIETERLRRRAQDRRREYAAKNIVAASIPDSVLFTEAESLAAYRAAIADYCVAHGLRAPSGYVANRARKYRERQIAREHRPDELS